MKGEGKSWGEGGEGYRRERVMELTLKEKGRVEKGVRVEVEDEKEKESGKGWRRYNEKQKGRYREGEEEGKGLGRASLMVGKGKFVKFGKKGKEGETEYR